jgi:hypothetical protein
VTAYDKAFSFIEEFSDYVLVDKQRKSLIANFKKEHFKVIVLELKKLNFKLTHVTKFKTKTSMTCVFNYNLK